MTGTPEDTTWKVLLEVCLNDMTVLRVETYTVHDYQGEECGPRGGQKTLASAPPVDI